MNFMKGRKGWNIDSRFDRGGAYGAWKELLSSWPAKQKLCVISVQFL